MGMPFGRDGRKSLTRVSSRSVRFLLVISQCNCSHKTCVVKKIALSPKPGASYFFRSVRLYQTRLLSFVFVVQVSFATRLKH